MKASNFVQRLLIRTLFTYLKSSQLQTGLNWLSARKQFMGEGQ